MMIATLTDNPAVAAQLNAWMKQYCDLYRIDPTVMEFLTTEELLEAGKTYRLDVIFIYLRGPEGFLHARRVREELPASHAVFIGDTMEYAVKCMRLHFTDYMVMPLEFKNFVRTMKLSGVG